MSPPRTTATMRYADCCSCGVMVASVVGFCVSCNVSIDTSGDQVKDKICVDNKYVSNYIEDMKIMLDLSPNQIAEYTERYNYDFWQLRTPLTRYALSGKPYGLDNGCFSRFDRKTWERLLGEAEICRPVFACLPDVVGDARRTLDLFEAFERQTNGLPRALVLQDGIGKWPIPWDKIEAVFVGGSDFFKISPECINACRTAKMLGKWVHIGRVNTAARTRDWLDLADSIDGSGVSRFDHMLEDVLAVIKGEHPQPSLL